ncbi:MAG: synthase subunit [Bacteroidota bacterium]|jgi:F-type H+-transporting ATPase subunit b
MELLLPELGLFVWTLLAFLVVFLILKKFAWKPILATLNDREKSIADSIASADKVRQEMESMKSENEQLLNQAREERSLMLKEAKDTKDKIVNDAKSQAIEEANKIMADARAQIQNEKMAALTDVKNQMGKLVIEVSEKVLRKELSDKSAQENYISTLAKEIKLN